MRASSPGSEHGVGVYLHVPFCARACPYCDFDFDVAATPDEGAYVRALGAEFAARATELGGVDVDTVYVGGGTPSTLSAETFRHIFETLASSVRRYSPEEITVEANPEHVTSSWVRALQRIGVTRVSLGVQSFSTQGLVTLGRAHRGQKAREAVETIHEAGLDGSVDLIVGWPGQTFAALDADIDTLVASGVAHVSVYALTIEPGTPWVGLVDRGVRDPVDEDAQGELLERTERLLVNAGFVHYEVASYAKPGKQAAHNRKYWRWRDFLGFGPSAASAVRTADGGTERRHNVRGFAPWTQIPGGGPVDTERLEGEAAAREGLWLGLRLLEPLDTASLEDRFQRPSGWVVDRLQRQFALGNVQQCAPGRVVVAPGRWLWHDVIAKDLLGPP